MDLNAIGRVILGVGLSLVILGLVLILVSRVPLFKYLGHLPGDIRIEGENVSCYLPLVSMLLISILLSLVLNIILRLLNR